MAGASLACGLAKEDVSIALVEERQPGDKEQQSYDDRGIALSLSSRKIFDAMGLWSKLEQSVCPIEQIHVSTQGTYGCVRMSAGLLDLDALGFVVSARELGRALFQEISNHDNIDMFCPAAATGIERDGHAVELRIRQAGGDAALTCRLLVVADGAFSGSRELVGINARTHDYRQTAIVGNVTISGDHCNTAYERFTPDGLVALLPLTDNRCVTVMVAPGDKAYGYLQADDDEYLNHLQQRFGKRLGRFSRLGARKSYPLLLVEPEQQAAERVVLLGNAAHTIHPNGAQGFNLVLRDVAGLVENLGAALREGRDVGGRDLLESYILSRKADQRQVIRFTDALQRTFNNTNPLKAFARNTTMFVLDALPPLKKEFIKRAAGLHAGRPVSSYISH